MIMAFITGPVGYIACFIFAWFINELPNKVRAVMTLVFYAPSIAGGVYTIWTYILSGDRYGVVNGIMMKLGIWDTPVLFLNDTDYMLTCCIIVQLWLSLGTSFLSFLAGFKTVDTTLYEAGAIDGVHNRFQEIWFLTLPQMKPQLMFGAVMQISSSFACGGVMASLCGMPSTDYATHTIINHISDYGGERYELGYACAISTVLLMIMLLVNKVINKLLVED
jgi:multiple sugar transport system permease protein